MIIAPSLLASNYGRFAAELRRVKRAGADWVHLDIMDGHFVPNISFGPDLVRTLRPLTRLPFDVHLMCSRPEVLLEPFAQAGANYLTVHVELGDKVTPLLWKIKSLGMRVGLAVNPPTAITNAAPYLRHLDLLLVMTVNPGFGGQSFIEEMIPKLQQADAWRREQGLAYRLEVDGGIDHKTAADCARAGADTFVSGTTLFRSRNMAVGVQKLRRIVLANAPAPPSVNAGPRVGAATRRTPPRKTLAPALTPD
jgi:ribulose-phosphate 3-epimerase